LANRKDLRGWMEDVDKMGELLRIENADWDLEIGCITELNRRKESPALLFDNIKDYPAGYRLLCSFVNAPSRVALTLGLPITHSEWELSQVVRQHIGEWENKAKDYNPKIVKSGPILENVLSGEDVNLLKFPVPRWHELDGGRYIGTGDAVITRDPDTGDTNLGTYRVMVHDEKTSGWYMSPGRHGKIHREKFHAQGKPCPVAVSVGQHPVIFGASSTGLSAVSEYNFAGAIRGEPIEVIRDESTGLLIPADAEIVFVGWSPVGKERQEGPFGEWTGYYGSKERAAPIIEVERIYHRNNPILCGAPPFRPPSDNHCFQGIVRSALIHNAVVNAGVPDVRGVWQHEFGVHTFTAIAIKQRYAGHAKQAALIADQNRQGAYMGRFVVVVDEDIDPTDITDVLWAMCFRCDPEKDIDIIRQAWASPLDPLIRKPTKAFYNSRAIINACKPFDWMSEFPIAVKSSPELVAKTKAKWAKKMGLQT